MCKLILNFSVLTINFVDWNGVILLHKNSLLFAVCEVKMLSV